MSAECAANADDASIAAGTSADHTVALTEATCPRCATAFTCGASAASCWCQALPTVDLARRPADLVGHGCLCGGCLGAVVAEQLAA